MVIRSLSGSQRKDKRMLFMKERHRRHERVCSMLLP